MDANPDASIKVVNTWHDATQSQGKYFNFNADDINLDVNEGDIDSLQLRHCHYPTWTATEEGRRYHFEGQNKCGDHVINVRREPLKPKTLLVLLLPFSSLSIIFPENNRP